MIEKLIVRNKSDLPMTNILQMAASVVDLGRISDGSYCYVTRFVDGLMCAAERNKASDTLTFWLK